MLIRLMAAALALTLAASAGCGGNEEKPEPLTKAQFTKQANQICTEINDKVLNGLSNFVEEQPNEGAGMSRSALFEKAVTTLLLPEAEEKATKIEALPPPVGDEEKLEAYLARLRSGIKVVQEQKQESFVDLKNSLYEFEKPFRSSRRLAVAYGMQEC